MYNVNKEIKSEGNGLNYLDVGIHDDVEMTSVEFKQSDKGNKFLVFTFEKDKKVVTHTEWEPKDQDPEKLEEKTINQIKRVKHIVTKYIPEEQYEFNVSNFEEFCNKTIALLGSKYQGKKVRIKIVYNYSNYTTLPNYVPFIEKMEVPKEDSRLEISSIDKMKKDLPDTEVKLESNPFDTDQDTSSADLPESESKEEKDDMPF
ncbi:MAG TPA: hypothetical protein VJ907_08880 [Halanaerobiales bacterium]|nr:hypothetical protein [Halanaerobiales bacterium]